MFRRARGLNACGPATTPPNTPHTPVPRRHTKRQDGQAVVEFVVILPVLLLVLMAIYQFGQVFVNYMDVTSAAREGARKGAVSRSAGTCSAVDALAVAAAKGAASDLSSSLGVTVGRTCTNNAYVQGGDVVVTATYPYSISIMGMVVTSGTLTSATTMRIE
jgi:Flp pilus assembly protein TadG